MKYTLSKAVVLPIIFVLIIALISSAVFVVIEFTDFKKLNESYTEAHISLENITAQNEKLSGRINELNEKAEGLKNENSAIKAENDNIKAEIEKKAEEQKKKEKEAEENRKATTVIDTTVPKEKACYLTFDDGPSENTLKILNILAEYNIKATFFVTGNGNSDYIRKIADAGHTVGLHTYTHNYSTVYSSDDAFFDDLYKIQNLVEEKTGIKSYVMRFPGGSSNTVSRISPKIMTRLTAAVREKGFQYFDWNVSSGDATGNNIAKSKLVSNVLNGAKGKSSVCVLMHDNAAKRTTVEALPEIIAGLANMGFYFEGLSVDSYGYHHGINN